MKTTKSQSEIQNQIDWLVKNKKNVLRESAFGDNHHDAIDAQIRVLRDDMPEDEIYNAFPTEESGEMEGEVVSSNVQDAALDARRWIDGDESISPMDNWKSLVRK